MTTYQQVALQNKDVLAKAGYAVDASGNVTYGPALIAEWSKTDPSSGKLLQDAKYLSPAEWSTSLPDAVKQQYGIQPSNPTSAIAPKNTLFDNSHGLFTDSTWDKNSGTFKSGIDWPMLLTTAGVAGAAGAAAIPAIAGGGGGGAAGGSAAATETGDAAALAESAAAPAAASAATAPAATMGSVYGPMAAAETGVAPTAAVTTGATVPASLASNTTLASMYGTPAAAAGTRAATAASGAKPMSIWGTIANDAINAGVNLYGAKQSSDASLSAAQTQAQSAKYAADLIAKAQADALAFQKQQWSDTQANFAPWLKTGSSAITTLGQLMGLSSTGSGSVPIQRSAPAPMPSTPTAMGTMYTGAPPPAGNAAAPAPNQASSPYVRISWGGGHEDTVPAAALDQYKLLGAQVI